MLHFVQILTDFIDKLYNLAHAEGLPPDWCIQNYELRQWPSHWVVQSPIILSNEAGRENIPNDILYRTYVYYGITTVPPQGVKIADIS